MDRGLNIGDRMLAVLDEALRTLSPAGPAGRPSPAAVLPEPHLSMEERDRSRALVRVNHAGEVAAQALYTGQAVGARTPATRAHLADAAREERDHLHWCRERLGELGGRQSVLTPFWYAGGFGLGLAAGLLGDRASLGFVVETERQVEAHLDDHLERIPAADGKSRAILEAMAADEARHGSTARAAGGARPPDPVPKLMALGGEILRRTAYYM